MNVRAFLLSYTSIRYNGIALREYTKGVRDFVLLLGCSAIFDTCTPTPSYTLSCI